MPRFRNHLTQPEQNEYRASVARLHDLGVAVGNAGDFLHGPERLRLEQLDSELAYVHELPGSGFVFTAPVRLTVLTSRILIENFEMAASWADQLLELEDPETFTFYDDVIAHCYHFPVTTINCWLTGEKRLRY